MGLLAGDGSPMGPTLFRGPTHGSRVGPNPRPAGGDPHPQIGIPAGVQMSIVPSGSLGYLRLPIPRYH